MDSAQYPLKRHERGTKEAKEIRTYRIREKIIARIEQHAKDHHVYPSHLVDFLLGKALDALDQGEIEIKVKPTGYTIDYA